MFSLDPTRMLRVTASMAPWLVSGDETIIQKMFLRMTNDPRYVDDGFSSTWPARFGTHVEQLALDFYAEQNQIEFLDRQSQFMHPSRDYVSATLDGRVMPGNIACDVKCINGFASMEERARFYLPQLIVQQECAAADDVALLFVKGGEQPVLWQYDPVNPDYRAAVWQRIEMFWQCVQSLTPPVELKFKRIVPPEKWRTIDFDDEDDLPNWANEMRMHLSVWADTHDDAKMHDRAKDFVKQLVPDDVGTILADKYQVKRNRRNALTITHRKENR